MAKSRRQIEPITRRKDKETNNKGEQYILPTTLLLEVICVVAPLGMKYTSRHFVWTPTPTLFFSFHLLFRLLDYRLLFSKKSKEKCLLLLPAHLPHLPHHPHLVLAVPPLQTSCRPVRSAGCARSSATNTGYVFMLRKDADA